jgi:regulatory protein
MITIVKTKHGNECVTVDLDNGEELKIPYQVAGLFRLESGRTVDTTEYAQLKEESQRYRCRNMALDYLAICPRSAVEMERYLGRKRFDATLIREIISGLKDAGYIDDADYAARYIQNKLGRKLVGRQLLASELQKKGISRSIINQALKDSGSMHSDMDALYAIALKKYDSIKDKKNSITKLSYFLHSRGFDADMVSSVIEKILKNEKEYPD